MGIVRHPKDFVAGVLFVAVGIAAIVIAANYPLGTAARMGPGYFPRILGILLIVLGSSLAFRALRIQGSALPGWQWRPVVIVLGSVVLFGLVVNIVGLALSTIGLILVSSAASKRIPAEGSPDQRNRSRDPRRRHLRGGSQAPAADLARRQLKGRARWSS